MKYKDLRILAICFLGFVLHSCVKYDTPIADSPLPLSTYSLSFDADGGEGVVKGLKGYSILAYCITIDGVGVTGDGDKNTPLINQWCTVNYDGKSSTVKVSPNETGKERRCEIAFGSYPGGAHSNVVSVVQSAD